jgi:hypothetical protein
MVGYISISQLIKYPPCNLGGGAGTPDSVEGPNVRHPVSTLLNQSLLSRVGSYLLQNQEPSTAKISDKENSCFLQNQEPHMCKHQNKWKNITCWVKTSKDDSVEICVRVDSVEMFCWSLILKHECLQVLQAPSKVPSACLWFCSMNVLTSFTSFYKYELARFSSDRSLYKIKVSPFHKWPPYICSTESGSKISSKNPSENLRVCIYIYIYVY